MCLMQTDFPVPDGPRIMEILSFGMPMFRPRRILLRPNALCTSTNSTASSTPDGPAARRIAVVTADEHDRGGHDHGLYEAVEEVRRVLEHPEDQRVAAAGD